MPASAAPPSPGSRRALVLLPVDDGRRRKVGDPVPAVGLADMDVAALNPTLHAPSNSSIAIRSSSHT